MDEHVERKIEYLHMLLGLIAGVISGGLGREGGIIGLFIGYSGFFLSRAVFKLDKEEFPMNTWVSKGALPFLMFWIPVWIFVFNL
jgi:hypothetical protein